MMVDLKNYRTLNFNFGNGLMPDSLSKQKPIRLLLII